MSDKKVTITDTSPASGPTSLQPVISQTQIAESALQARIREKLNNENIKLWIEPFILEGKTNDHEILALASRYATELTMPETDIFESLLSLQRNSIDRLTERSLYHQTGLATIRVKFSGFSTNTVKSGNTTRIQVNLQKTNGAELKKMIADLTSIEEKRLKLICSGRVLDENILLQLQNLKNGGMIMVLLISADQEVEAHQQEESQFRQLEEAKVAADLLASRSIEDIYSLQVADQNGKALDLPEEERKTLAVALLLHGKGRKAMKNSEFSKGLVFLLEAENVYSRCQYKILENVDNFGMLNLDIAWSYLNLQSISELPQTESRLSQCEKSLKRSYGENMERVITLKGTCGWEAALYVRLHLLQGIAAYHQGQIEKAKFFMAKVEADLIRLRVSDEQLASLINMGYTPDEARMALRSTNGDIERAVDWIIRQREEQIRIDKEEAETIRLRKLQRRLGFTENGTPVNITLYRNMKEMGYDFKLVLAALKRTNNNINLALQLVSDPMFISSVISKSEPTLATQSTPSGTEVAGTSSSQSEPSITATTVENIPQQAEASTAESDHSTVDSTGENNSQLDAPSSSQSLPSIAVANDENNTPLDNAMGQLREILSTMDGSNFPADLDQILGNVSATGISKKFRAFIQEVLDGSMGDDFDPKLRAILSSIPDLPTEFKHFLEKSLAEASITREERKAYDSISEDMGSEADYIDLGLSAETAYLEQYKALLQM